MPACDVVFVGGGHNGLIAASRLARAGLKTLVLERRSVAGGAAATEELHPGFRCSTLAHTAQPSPVVLAELRLAEHGLELYGILKAKGVEARLVYYPDENHWILKPQNSLHWFGEFLGWLKRHLG